ncbi:hypothetical protein OHA98_39490 [Streptomyces sp. NBC_00654]|uniref:hypothetical protein n=1 Tax=Streptomyces sp. NBC_00654 TaxID=2975799 RepID=UPI00225A3E94|nr:hypothetical protein [Streptomyces sp. NBC_00654]MCX4970735.1 hypothetical protein [Streptomyces sp. NBC_00654]
MSPSPAGTSGSAGGRTTAGQRRYRAEGVEGLRIYPQLNKAAAIQRLPFQVEVIPTDNGADVQSAFPFHVLDKGIAHASHRA